MLQLPIRRRLNSSRRYSSYSSKPNEDPGGQARVPGEEGGGGPHRAAYRGHFGAGDKVAVRLRLRGTHSGDFPGILATGHTVEYVSHEFYRIADGLAAEECICWDMATLLRQLS